VFIQAEQQVGEMDGFKESLVSLETELDAISSYAAEMVEVGVVKNAYSRFELDDLVQMSSLCQAALASRGVSVHRYIYI